MLEILKFVHGNLKFKHRKGTWKVKKVKRDNQEDTGKFNMGIEN